MKRLVQLSALLAFATGFWVHAGDEKPLRVVTRPAEEKAMPRYLRVTGELKGSRDAMVAADASGKVVDTPVERGSVVKQGDVLLRLDDSAARLSLNEAEASLASAKLKIDWADDELKRNQPLASAKAISDNDFARLKNERASAEAGMAAAVARRDIARKTRDDAVIRAPFAGTVAERLADLGEYVRQDSQVVHLVQVDKLHLWLNVPETAAGLVREGQQVSFTVPAFPGRVFPAVVKYIGAAVRASARDLIIEAEAANTDGSLKPGMFAEGRIALAHQLAVTVPASALKVDGMNRRLMVVQGEHMEERLVETGETQGDSIEIRHGVSKGEAVVVAPAENAADGMKVSLAN